MAPTAIFEDGTRIDIIGNIDTWETSTDGTYTEHISLSSDAPQNEQMLEQNGKNGLFEIDPDEYGDVNVFRNRSTEIDPNATLEVTVKG